MESMVDEVMLLPLGVLALKLGVSGSIDYFVEVSGESTDYLTI